MATFKVITADEDTTFLNVFDRFGWQQGYVGCFNLLVNLNKALRQHLTKIQREVINYMIHQVFEYAASYLQQWKTVYRNTADSIESTCKLLL